MSNVLLFAVLRISSSLLGIIPASIMYRLARIAGWCAYYTVRKPREGIIGNLAIVMRLPPTSPAVRAVARTTFQHDAMNWVDTLRIGRLSLDEISTLVRVDGWEVLETAAASGQGVSLVTLHLGNFDLVGQVLSKHGFRLTVPVESMRPRALFNFLVQQRTRNGITIVPVEHASRDLIRALRAGELVGLAGDRNIAGRTAPVSVFGRTASLPTGPVSLARRTKSPLLLAVGVRERPGRFLGLVRAVPMTYTGDASADDARNLSEFAGMMEQIVTQFPGQWLAFRPFWDRVEGENGAVTMDHHRRAAV